MTACTGPEPVDASDPFAEAMQAALESGASAIDAPGAVLVTTGPDFSGATGFAEVTEPIAMTSEHAFRIGSITKTFVAAVALELHGEGVLDLDQPASIGVPSAPHAAEYTLRQCLAHSAGLPDYVDDLGFLANLDEEHSPDELLAYIEGEELLFDPGEGFFYSNAGYVVVGMAIEAAVGHDYAIEVRRRFVEPLGLSGTFVPSYDGEPENLAHGYMGEGELVDVTASIHPSGPWASGEMVSTGADLAVWGRALYLGDALEPGLLDQMLEDSGHGYGLGVYLEDESVGHSGSTQGFQGRLRVRGDTVVVSLVNNFFAEADVIDSEAWAVLGTD